MCKILIFAGTLEGRKTAEYLNERRIPARVCVATEYGESLLPRGAYLKVSHQRMGQREMECLMEEMKSREGECLVIDATHPYAAEVTENIRKACASSGCSCIRVIRRETQVADDRVIWKDTVQDAVEFLKDTQGGILVTTGSKELSAFTELPDYRNRVYARVLSIPKVVETCAALGFQGKHLICMQGPFSRELNSAMIRQLNVRWVVTKESGTTGGFPEKYEAAKETGTGLVIIGRPFREEGKTLEECIRYLDAWLNLETESVENNRETPRISLVGIGMGNRETLTVEGARELDEAQLLIGAARMLEPFARADQKIYQAYRPEDIRNYIQAHPEYRRIAIALSGDVGFYSGARKLLQVLGDQVHVYCGISSLVYFCARIHTPWEDVYPVSVHGRKRNLPGLLKKHPRVFAIIGSDTGVGEICRKLTSCGMGQIAVTVGERLSYPDERITCGTAESFADGITDPLCVLLLENPEAAVHVVTHGISDEAFLRDRVPMTKEEVRSISLSKLRLQKDSVIYDIGAGTGSVAVEMALQAVDGCVYAVEKKPEAVELIYRNREKFGTDNLEVVEGLAPEACRELPVPSHAFIGGSSGNLKEILQLLLEKNPRIRMVINCITLETVAEAAACLNNLPVDDVDIAQVTVAKGKKAGSYHLMMGQNPVTVFSCTGKPQES